MNPNYSDIQKESSTSGYTPYVQVTTGTYCVTSFSAQSSDKPYSDCSSSNKDGQELYQYNDK